MSTPHRATFDQWAHLEICAREKLTGYSCILELRARIEALEAGATCPHIVSSDEGTSYCRLAKQTQDKLDRLIELDRANPAPAGSLMERVAGRVEYGIDAEQDPEGIARAAIREVAAWLDERDTSIQNQPGCLEAPFADDAVRWLRREAER